MYPEKDRYADWGQQKTSSPQSYAPLPCDKKKPLFDLSKKDGIFAILAVLFSIFTAMFGISEGFALGYGISSGIMTILLFVYFCKDSKIHLFSVFCGLLSLALCGVFLCTTNRSVRFFTVIIAAMLTLVCLDGIVNGALKSNRQTLGVFYTAICTIRNLGVAIKSIFSGNGERKTAGKALVGLLCAIPVLIVIVPLLISSDEAFQGMMQELFGDMGSTVGDVVSGLLISVFIITYGFSMRTKRVNRIKESHFSGIENVYVISFLSAISLCYLLYLFSQLAYFFSAFRGFLPDGEMTYAQYARKGFFEMCIIAVINLALVSLALILPKKKDQKVCGGIKALTTFVAVFTLIIIATAISKMVLYIGVYGMTILRLTTSAFMLFLAVVFVSLILRIYVKEINVLKTALVAAGCILLVLGLSNVNAVCAKYNYQSYISGRLDTIDVAALYSLGDEGIVYITKLATDQNRDVATKAQDYLEHAYRYKYFDNVVKPADFTVENMKKNQKISGFGSFSLPKAKAYDELYQFIEDNPTFVKTRF